MVVGKGGFSDLHVNKGPIAQVAPDSTRVSVFLFGQSNQCPCKSHSNCLDVTKVWTRLQCSEEELWDTVPLAAERKSDRIGLSRWFGWVVGVRHFMRMRVRRLLLSIYVAVNLDYFKGGRFSTISASLLSDKSSTTVDKESTAVESDEVRSLRQKSGNTFAFCATLLADRWLWVQIAGISELLLCVQKFHSHQNKLNRSASESLDFWVQAVATGGLEELNAIITKLHSKEFARGLGLKVWDLEGKGTRVAREDPEAQQGNDIAAVCGRLAVSLLLRRSRSLAELTLYPISFLKLLSPGVDAPAFMDELKWRYDKYQAMLIEGKENKFLHKLAQRSCFRMVKVKQYVAICEAHGWHVSEELLQQVREDWRGLTQTKVVEDGFACGRMAELSRNSRGSIASDRAYETLIRSDVLAHKHRFTEVPCDSQPLPRGCLAGYEHLFSAPPGGTPKDWRKVISTDSKACSANSAHVARWQRLCRATCLSETTCAAPNVH